MPLGKIPCDVHQDVAARKQARTNLQSGWERSLRSRMSNQEIRTGIYLTPVTAPGLRSIIRVPNNPYPACPTLAGTSTIVANAPLDAPVEGVVVPAPFTDEEVPKSFLRA